MMNIVISMWCCMLLCHVATSAQVDDLAERTWAAADIEALERYRTEPLCLPCLTASDLTVLPGIDRRAASRVVRATQAGLGTLEAIADSACLTIDQSIILFATTTLHCSCDPIISGARLQQRLYAVNGSPPDLTTRVDVEGRHGTVGGVFREDRNGTLREGWARYSSDAVKVAIGNYGITSGLGLMHATSTRTLIAQPDVRLLPWTSTWTDGALTGAALMATVPMHQATCSVLGAWSHRQDNAEFVNVGVHLADSTRSVFASVRTTNGAWSHASLFGSLSIARWQFMTELLTTADHHYITAAMVRYDLARGQVVFGASWSDPELDGRWRASAAVVWSALRSWHVEAFAELHGITSRSYGRPMPSRGVDVILDARRRLTSNVQLDGRLRYEIDDEGWRADGALRTAMFTRHRVTVRGAVRVQPTRDVTLRARLDVRSMWSEGSRQSERGILGGVDVVWSPTPALRISGQFLSARSPSIESAAYTMIVPVAGAMRMIVGTGNSSWFVVSGRWSVVPWCTVAAAVVEQTRDHTPLQRAAYVQCEVRLPR